MDKNQKTLHEKAIRLIEGGVAEVDSLVVRAVKVPEGYEPCFWCSMDCLCKGDIAKLCAELDLIDSNQYKLKLAWYNR